MIKAWDYLEEYKKDKKKILSSIDRALKSGKLFFGNQLTTFEKKFTKLNKSQFGVGVGSGTDAIYIALKALGIGHGDEVITVSYTAIPTVAAIINTGASVKFVDINKHYLMDTKQLEKKITNKTKVIIPVHLYGQSCDMNEILRIAKKNKLKIVEDCAQAQGATYKNKKVGTFGDFGCFSFYPTKILGSYGDGGFITTNNFNLYQKAKRLRFYGLEEEDKKKWWNKKYFSIQNGVNSRLSEIQASILNFKIKNTIRDIKKRRLIANFYNKKLSKINLIKPVEIKNNFHVYHLFVVAHKDRDKILRILKKKKINLGINYPYPLHKMKAYNKFVPRKCSYLSMSEKFTKMIFSLPIYPTIKKKDLLTIVRELNNIIKTN